MMSAHTKYFIYGTPCGEERGRGRVEKKSGTDWSREQNGEWVKVSRKMKNLGLTLWTISQKNQGRNH